MEQGFSLGGIFARAVNTLVSTAYGLRYQFAIMDADGIQKSAGAIAMGCFLASWGNEIGDAVAKGAGAVLILYALKNYRDAALQYSRRSATREPSP